MNSGGIIVFMPITAMAAEPPAEDMEMEDRARDYQAGAPSSAEHSEHETH